MRKVRFRSLGGSSLSGAIESDADTLAAIIEETLPAAELGTEEVATYLGERDRRSLLRFVMCGSIADGTSIKDIFTHG